MPQSDVTALVAVYSGTPAEQLALALDSVVAQTRPPDEIVIVEDGPLTDAHLAVLDVLEAAQPVNRLRLPVNRGQGVANQAGLKAARGTWVAKVDADDISEPRRFELQLARLDDSGADVCGTAMLEFDDDPTVPTSLRRSPSDHESIVRAMRTNNPISHPTAMFRRELALRSGGYPDLRFAEDYVLFARMWRSGAVFTNLPEPLVRFRADAGMHARRRLGDQAGAEWRLQQELVECGLVSGWRRWGNLLVRLGYRSLPTPLRRAVHRRVLGRVTGAFGH